MPTQARLPGTLPSPPIARANFNRAHETWRKAARDLETAKESARGARKRLRAAVDVETAESDDYVGAKDGADAVVLKQLLQANTETAKLAATYDDASAILRESRKAEREASARRQRCLDDLRAVGRGER